MKTIKHLFAIGATLMLTIGFTSCNKTSTGGTDNTGGEDTPTTPVEHVHTYSEEWSHDDTYHWHAATCEHTDLVSDKAEHTLGEWETVTEPTYTEAGLKHQVCTVCGYAREEAIPTLDKIEAGFAFTNRTKIYDGKEFELVRGVDYTIAEDYDGEITYETVDADRNPTTTFVPGDYYIRLHVGATSKYNEKAYITKATITPRVLTVDNLQTFWTGANGRTDIPLTAEHNVIEGDKVSLSTTATLTWDAGNIEFHLGEAGSGYEGAKLTGLNSGCYTFEVGHIKVLKVLNSWTTPLTMQSWTYGETPAMPTAVAKYGIVQYNVERLFNGVWRPYSYSSTSTIPAGQYRVVSVVEGTTNFFGITSDPVEFTVSPKVLELTISRGYLQEKAITLGAPKGIINDDVVELVRTETGKKFDAGTYGVGDVELSGTNKDNYTLLSANITIIEQTLRTFDVIGHPSDENKGKISGALLPSGKTQYWYDHTVAKDDVIGFHEGDDLIVRFTFENENDRDDYMVANEIIVRASGFAAGYCTVSIFGGADQGNYIISTVLDMGKYVAGESR